MTIVDEVISAKYARYGYTLPQLALHDAGQLDLEAKWQQAKAQVHTRNPVDWLDFVLDEWLGSGQPNIHTVSDLKHYGILREQDGLLVIDRVKRVFDLFTMSLEIDNVRPNYSGVLLFSRQLGLAYRYPDWDSLRQLAGMEKKQGNHRLW